MATILGEPGPAIRTAPIPPSPGGVIIAVMVSSFENLITNSSGLLSINHKIKILHFPERRKCLRIEISVETRRLKECERK